MRAKPKVAALATAAALLFGGIGAASAYVTTTAGDPGTLAFIKGGHGSGGGRGGSGGRGSGAKGGARGEGGGKGGAKPAPGTGESGGGGRAIATRGDYANGFSYGHRPVYGGGAGRAHCDNDNTHRDDCGSS